MAKPLNFNKLSAPVLPLIMADGEETKITVCEPKKSLVTELQAALPELAQALEAKDDDALDAAYDLAARLISCNREGLVVTGKELYEKYGIGVYFLQKFFPAYVDFMEELSGAKN